MASKKYLSTGVLNTHTNTVSAHAELVNLDPKKTAIIQVKVKDWDSGLIIFDTTLTLPPNVWDNPVIPLGGAGHYEMRYNIIDGNDDVVINSYGVDGTTFGNQEGNTVLFQDLADISKKAFELN